MNILKRYFYAPSLFILTFLWLHSAAPAQIAAAEKSTYGLSGSCYADMNASGGFDDGDQVIDNATVTVSRLVLGFFLIPVAAQQTGADGTYAFTDLKRGFYRAECRPEIDAEPVTTNPAILLLGFLKPERTLDFGFEAAAEDVMPVTVSIDADPLHIASGESAVLSWSSEYAGRVTIDNGIGEVEPSGSLTVYPADNTTYTATAVGTKGLAADSVSITVQAPPPVPESTTTTTIETTSTTTTTIAASSGGGGGGSPASSSIPTTSSTSTSTIAVPEPPPPAGGLIAAPGDAKVGLAWSNPDDDSRWAGTLIVRTAGEPPHSPDDGIVVYDGTGTDCVDEELMTNNQRYYYAAFSYNTGPVYGEADNGSRACATPLPVAEADWSDWRNQPDPFADAVAEYADAVVSGMPQGFDNETFPDIVLGPPAGGGNEGGSVDVLSLGARRNDDNGTSAPYGGHIILAFTDNIIVNGPGADFTVFENPFVTTFGGSPGRFMEPALVSVSQDGETFYQFPCDFMPPDNDTLTDMELIQHCRAPEHYAEGFAGIKPVYANGLDPDPTDPAVSGGDSFDLDSLEDVPLSWIRYVKIQSTGDHWLTDADGDLIRHTPETGACSGSSNSGFDLDAVSAINY